MDLARELEGQERKIREMHGENGALKEEKEILYHELEKVREANAQLEEAIGQIEQEITNDVDRYR